MEMGGKKKKGENKERLLNNDEDNER